MDKPKIYIKNNQDILKIGFFIKKLIKRCCKIVLEVEKFNEKAEISVLFVDDDKIRILNQKHRNQNKSTDVLSFALRDEFGFEMGKNGVIVLGDIVISTQTAIAQAEEYGHSIKREIAFLVVHSMLHLLGYDHENDEIAKNIMRRKEKLILTKLKIN